MDGSRHTYASVRKKDHGGGSHHLFIVLQLFHGSPVVDAGIRAQHGGSGEENMDIRLAVHHALRTRGPQPVTDAHGIVGRLVLTCIDKGISLDELPLEEYKAISPVFENDIYEAISMKTCVEKRMTIGAPGPDVMEKVIAENKKYLEEN